ncbi:Vesicle-trafficking protein SEC22a [Nymphon striatum]|nr:Vesicle-trafficking protein SEC22a [Nymphon striatum]
MINFAMVVRTRDGLALSESTDSQQSPTHRSARKYIKLLQKNISSLQERCIVQLNSQKILLASFWSFEQCLAQQATSLLEAEGIRQMCPVCTNVWVRDLGNYGYPVEKICECPTQYGKKDPRLIKSVGISYIALCDNSYPNVLGYSYLNEMRKEFMSTYENRHIVAAIRPYSFIDFDFNIKKMKAKYNNPRSLTTKLNLSDMSEEIKLRPPVNIPVSMLESKNQYGVNFKQERTDPITCTAWISVAVTSICAFFNFSRGVIFLNTTNWDGLDYKSPTTGFLFLFESVLEISQVYLFADSSHETEINIWFHRLPFVLFM